MPNVRIRFQGICLFCAQNDVVRVFLPDASGNGPHPPNGHAEPHIARLFVQQRGNGTDKGHYAIRTLNGHEIAFHGANGPIGGGVSNPAVLRGLPSLKDFAAKVSVDSSVTSNGARDTRVVAVATIRAGTLQPVSTPKRGPWKVRKLKKGAPEYHRPNSLKYWMNVSLQGVSEVVLTDRDGVPETIAVVGSDIIIGNRPETDENDWLPEKPRWTTNSSSCDHHFPWHYTLLTSTSGETLTKRLTDLGEIPRPCFGNAQRVTHPGRGSHGRYRILSDDYPTCFCLNC